LTKPKPLLQVENLSVEFRTDEGVVHAVNNISFSLEKGETLGLVGESGSGKSVTNLAMMGLVPMPPGKITSGKALFQQDDGNIVDLLALSPNELRKRRGRNIAMIFQDPMTALNPFMTVGEQLSEMTMLHFRHTSRQAMSHAISMLEQVGIPSPEQRVHQYPHEFSGGMRQRVMIAMALSCKPDLLIADEPTTALDVTVQAQVLDLIRDLQETEGTSVILITHNLGVVANMCQRVAVLYGGRIIEEAPVNQIFDEPMHPYTLGLLASIPKPNDTGMDRLQAIPGQPPNMSRPPSGCAFHPRCEYMEEVCKQKLPPLVEPKPGHRHACLFDIATKPITAKEAARA
jgi:oligopeptide transport system ATP-binding protein